MLIRKSILFRDEKRLKKQQGGTKKGKNYFDTSFWWFVAVHERRELLQDVTLLSVAVCEREERLQDVIWWFVAVSCYLVVCRCL